MYRPTVKLFFQEVYPVGMTKNRWDLTHILPGQYQDIAQAISWESGLPMTLIPSQFKEAIHFDSLY